MSDFPLAHTPFVHMLEHFVEHGSTTSERELAQMLLDIYLLVPTEPQVVEYVNRFTLRVMS